MSEELKTPIATQFTSTIATQHASAIEKPATMEWMVLEINKIPKEYWPHLLKMIELYGATVAMKAPPAENSWEQVMAEIKNADPIVEAARNQAARALLKSWREEGDEEDQKETWEILNKAFNENGICI